MSKTPEKKIQDAVLAWLERAGVDAWRNNTGTAVYGGGYRVPAFGGSVAPPVRRVSFGRPGSADITGILPDGRRLEVEIKRSGSGQTRMQKKFQEMIERNRGVYLLVSSVEELADGLNGIMLI